MHAKRTLVFFAVGHPILQPILWISDVLHGSPGPMVGDLVPLSFILGNVAFIGLTAFSKQVSNHLYLHATLRFFNGSLVFFSRSFEGL